MSQFRDPVLTNHEQFYGLNDLEPFLISACKKPTEDEISSCYSIGSTEQVETMGEGLVIRNLRLINDSSVVKEVVYAVPRSFRLDPNNEVIVQLRSGIVARYSVGHYGLNSWVEPSSLRYVLSATWGKYIVRRVGTQILNPFNAPFDPQFEIEVEANGQLWIIPDSGVSEIPVGLTGEDSIILAAVNSFLNQPVRHEPFSKAVYEA